MFSFFLINVCVYEYISFKIIYFIELMYIRYTQFKYIAQLILYLCACITPEIKI